MISSQGRASWCWIQALGRTVLIRRAGRFQEGRTGATAIKIRSDGFGARCAFCGRISTGGGLTILGRPVCEVCERITVALPPAHPLYPFWISVVKGLYRET